MRKILRETIDQIKEAGGTGIKTSIGGRHTFIDFTVGERNERMTLHLGSKVRSRHAATMRSQLRRKIEGTEA